MLGLPLDNVWGRERRLAPLLASHDDENACRLTKQYKGGALLAVRVDPPAI